MSAFDPLRTLGKRSAFDPLRTSAARPLIPPLSGRSMTAVPLLDVSLVQDLIYRRSKTE